MMKLIYSMGLILAYTKNQLVFWFDDKEQLLEVDVIC